MGGLSIFHHISIDCPRGLAIAQDKTTTSCAIASHSKELLVLQETSKPWDSQHHQHLKPQWHSAGDATVSSCQIERVVWRKHKKTTMKNNQKMSKDVQKMSKRVKHIKKKVCNVCQVAVSKGHCHVLSLKESQKLQPAPGAPLANLGKPWETNMLSILILISTETYWNHLKPLVRRCAQAAPGCPKLPQAAPGCLSSASKGCFGQALETFTWQLFNA